MRKILFFAIIFMFASGAYAETISLTEAQYKRLPEIDKALKAKYAQFKGFNGSREKLEVIGLPAAAVADEIKKIDFLKLEAEDVEFESERDTVKTKLIDLAIAEAEKAKPLKHKERVRAELLREA